MEKLKEIIFIDASVWVAASRSPNGGSALVLEICRGKRFAAVLTQRVLMEAQTNIRHKLPVESLVRFYQLLADVAPEVVPRVSVEQEQTAASIVVQKDAHVLAAALASEAIVLVTLDRKHLANEQVRQAVSPLLVLTAGEFIQYARRLV